MRLLLLLVASLVTLSLCVPQKFEPGDKVCVVWDWEPGRVWTLGKEYDNANGIAYDISTSNFNIPTTCRAKHMVPANQWRPEMADRTVR